jgi:hypothetical protein
MQTLEEEAQEYFSKDNGLYCAYSVKNKEDKFTSVVSEVRAIDFVKESKWVQSEKIKAQIEENKSVLKMLKIHGTSASMMRVSFRIEDLQKQLKQLEDGQR